MGFRLVLFTCLGCVYLQVTVTSGEAVANTTEVLITKDERNGTTVDENSKLTDQHKTENSGGELDRLMEKLDRENIKKKIHENDERIPGMEWPRYAGRFPWIGGDIQRMAVDLYDARLAALRARAKQVGVDRWLVGAWPHQLPDEFHKVAETLLELLVHIAENPDQWKKITEELMAAHDARNTNSLLPPEMKKSHSENKNDLPPLSQKPSQQRFRNGGRRKGAGGKKKKPRQNGKDKQNKDKGVDENRTDLPEDRNGRPITQQAARRQRLRQLAEAGVVVPTGPPSGRGAAGVVLARASSSPPLPTRETPLQKQDWKDFHQRKMEWKLLAPRPTSSYPFTGKENNGKILNAGSARKAAPLAPASPSRGGQKFGTLTRHAPDRPSVLSPLDRVRQMPINEDTPRGGAGGGSEGVGSNLTLNTLRQGALLSRDEMLQRLLENRPLPAELDLISRQLGRFNKTTEDDDEYRLWKQQMSRKMPLAPLLPTPDAMTQRYNSYPLTPPRDDLPAAQGWGSDSRLPLFGYHRLQQPDRGPFASISVPNSADHLRSEQFPTGRLVRMRDPLEQQLADMAASAERHRLLQPPKPGLSPWDQPTHHNKVQEHFESLSAIEDKLRFHTQESDRLRQILRDTAKAQTGALRGAI